MTRQNQRLLERTVFFALFVLAPPLDILRLDLTLGHFILFGYDWTLGLAAFQTGEIGPGQAVLNLVLRAFLPLAAIVAVFGFAAWKWGLTTAGLMTVVMLLSAGLAGAAFSRQPFLVSSRRRRARI